MIEEPTVFVLGAGASVPFGFPIGSKLLSRVVGEIGQSQTVSELHSYCSFDGQEIARFKTALENSGQMSVDAFLEHREEFLEIGKASIALALIKFEQRQMLFGEAGGNWLKYLYGRMHSSFEDFGKNRVAFLTFNYDRTVEEFLFTALSNTYGKSPDECLAQLNQIPIIHLHGTIGTLPWQGGDSRPFEPIVNHDTLNVARKGIKIIHEATTDGRDKDFEKGLNLLLNAKRIVFLGFGYNSLNMERLGIRHAPITAVGTGFDLTPAEIADFVIASGGKIDIQPGFDCLTLFRSLRWR